MFMRVLPTEWRRKPAGIDVERNDITVTPSALLIIREANRSLGGVGSNTPSDQCRLERRREDRTISSSVHVPTREPVPLRLRRRGGGPAHGFSQRHRRTLHTRHETRSHFSRKELNESDERTESGTEFQIVRTAARIAGEPKLRLVRGSELAEKDELRTREGRE